MTPIVVSWSGGKDAAWMLHALQQAAAFRPVALLTSVTDGGARVAMHGIRREVLHAQAAAAGLPLIEARQPQACSNADYETAMARALQQAEARFPGVRHIAYGDLFLADIRAWRDGLCARHGWSAVYPLFGRDTAALACEMLAGGLRARLCCIDTGRLDPAFGGAEFSRELLDALPDAVDPCGENGEFHTCVYDGPMFASRLRLRAGATVLRDARFAFTDFALEAGD